MSEINIPVIVPGEDNPEIRKLAEWIASLEPASGEKAFDESEHPRDDEGRFARVPGGGGSNWRDEWRPTMTPEEGHAWAEAAGTKYAKTVVHMTNNHSVDGIKGTGFDMASQTVHEAGRYFALDPDDAQFYTYKGNQAVSAVVVTKKPLVLDWREPNSMSAFAYEGRFRAAALKEAGFSPDDPETLFNTVSSALDEDDEEQMDNVSVDADTFDAIADNPVLTTAALKASGYDAVIIHPFWQADEDPTTGGDQIIVFDREQAVAIGTEELYGMEEAQADWDAYYASLDTDEPLPRPDTAAIERAFAKASEFTERLHPRDAHGRFTETPGSGLSEPTIQQSPTTVLVSIKDEHGRVAGQLNLGRAGGNEYTVDAVGIEPDYRRQGLATKLAEKFHEEFPDGVLVHGLFSSDAGRGWAARMIEEHPDWNRAAETPPLQQNSPVITPNGKLGFITNITHTLEGEPIAYVHGPRPTSMTKPYPLSELKPADLSQGEPVYNYRGEQTARDHLLLGNFLLNEEGRIYTTLRDQEVAHIRHRNEMVAPPFEIGSRVVSTDGTVGTLRRYEPEGDHAQIELDDGRMLADTTKGLQHAGTWETPEGWEAAGMGSSYSDIMREVYTGPSDSADSGRTYSVQHWGDTPHDSPQVDALRASIPRMINWNADLEEDTGLKNAWNGSLIYDNGIRAGAAAVKNWECSISINDYTVGEIKEGARRPDGTPYPLDPRTLADGDSILIHELVHGLSDVPKGDYAVYPAFEEGVVQAYTEAFQAVQAYGPSSSARNARIGMSHYPMWTRGMYEAGDLSTGTSGGALETWGDRLEFLRGLLQTPLGERMIALEQSTESSGWRIVFEGSGIGTRMTFHRELQKSGPKTTQSDGLRDRLFRVTSLAEAETLATELEQYLAKHPRDPIAREAEVLAMWISAHELDEGPSLEGQKDFDPSQPRDRLGRWTDGGVLDVVELEKPLVGQTQPRELPVFDITQAAQDEIYTKLERVGVTHAALAEEIGTRILQGGQGLIDEAKQWYPQAKRTASEMSRDSNGRIDPVHAEALIAALSPQMEWDQNVAVAQAITSWVAEGRSDNKTPEASALEFIKEQFAFAEEHGYNKPFLDRRKAVDAMSIAMGGSIDEHLNGLKVRSFFNNINDPGGTRDVTIDTHMVKVMNAVSPGMVKKGPTNASALGLLNAHSAEKGKQYGGAGYVAISEAVRTVSTELGIPPDTVQAAYWLAVRDTKYEDIRPAGEAS